MRYMKRGGLRQADALCVFRSSTYLTSNSSSAERLYLNLLSIPKVIGPKNKGCVTRTTTYSKTPVSNLFLGLMRSALHHAGAQSTATLQPFFSLQLDIQVRPDSNCSVHKLVSRF